MMLTALFLRSPTNLRAYGADDELSQHVLDPVLSLGHSNSPLLAHFCQAPKYSIFFKDNMLFSYFEYYGNKVEEDWARMAADPKTQQWWAVMMPMQEPLPSRNEGEWWATMEEVFHLD